MQNIGSLHKSNKFFVRTFSSFFSMIFDLAQTNEDLKEAAFYYDKILKQHDSCCRGT